MAQNIVGSLFGPTPEQLQRERTQQQAILSQNANRVSPSYGIGYNVGTLLGQGLGALFGVKDPELERATGVRKILQDTQSQLGEQAQDPALLFTTLQERLAEAGFGEEATLAAQQAQQAKLQQVDIARQAEQGALFKAQALKALREDDPKQKLFFEIAKNSSPKAVVRAINNGYDLALLDSPEKNQYSPLARQLIDAGFEYGSPQFNTKMLEFLEAEKAGKTKGSGNVSIGGISIDSGKVGEEAGKVVGKEAAVIENKFSALDSVSDALSMVDAGINAGLYGPTKQFITKATGGTIGSQAKVENTERFLSYVGNVVIPRLQEFGGNDSVEELKYLRQVMAGETTLEPNSIKRILADADKKIRRGIERTQRQLESASSGKPIPVDAGPSRAQPKATKRYNRETKEFEVID